MKKILVMMIAVIATSIAVAGGRVVTDLSGEGWTLDGEAVTVPHTWNAVDGTDGIGARRHRVSSVAAQSYVRRRGVNLCSGDNEIEVSAGGMSRSAHWNRAVPRRDDDQKTASRF